MAERNEIEPASRTVDPSPASPASPVGDGPQAAIAPESTPVGRRRNGWWKHQHWLVLLILVLALVLRWPGMEKSLWEDEVGTFDWSRQPLGSPLFLDRSYGGGTTAFWTTIMVIRVCDWLMWTGTASGVRLPLLGLALLGVLAGWGLGHLLRMPSAGLLLATGLAVWPFKVYWDTQIRFYSVMMASAMLMLAAAEAWRRRPRWWTYGAFLGATALTVLSNMTAAVLLALPPIYLAWVWAERIGRAGWRWSFRKERPDRRRVASAFGAFALQSAALMGVSLLLLRFTMGQDWIVQKVAAAWPSSAPETAAVAPDQAAGLPAVQSAPVQTTKVEDRTDAMTIPTPQIVGDRLRRMIRGVGRPGAWQPAALFMLDAQPHTLWQLIDVMNEQDAAKGPVPPAWAIMAALALGTLVLLWRSPPLAASLWFCILMTGLLLGLNRDVQWTTTRHYALPGLFGVIVASVGLGGIIDLLGWPLRRRFPAAGRLAPLAASLAVALWCTVVALPRARVMSLHEAQQWKQFYALTRRTFPQGALYTGFGTKNVRFYRDLEAAAQRLHRDDSYWSLADRCSIIDAYTDRPKVADMALLDRLNGCQGVVLLRYDYSRLDFQPLTFLPELRAGVAEQHRFNARYRLVPLGHWIGVPRGHLTLPLMPRLEVAGEGEAVAYRMECRHEAPGEYELNIGQAGATSPTRVLVDGRPVVFQTDRVPADQPFRWRDLDAQWSSGPATASLAMAPTLLTRLRIQTRHPSDQLTNIEIEYARRPESVPIVEWRYAQKNWDRASEYFSIGDLYQFLDADGFHCYLPLRVEKPPPFNLQLTSRLMLYAGPPTGQPPLNKVQNVVQPRRDMRVGDIVGTGILTIDRQNLESWAGKPMSLYLAPSFLEWLPGGEYRIGLDLTATDGPEFKNANPYLICLLRWEKIDGEWRVQFGKPNAAGGGGQPR